MSHQGFAQMTYLTTPRKANGWNLKIPHEWGGERGNIGGEERQSQTPDASEKYNNPKTLHGALCFLRCDASMKEIFDQLWRLTMSLRYWHGGADRHWIPNPRSCRPEHKWEAQLVPVAWHNSFEAWNAQKSLLQQLCVLHALQINVQSIWLLWWWLIIT